MGLFDLIDGFIDSKIKLIDNALDATIHVADAGINGLVGDFKGAGDSLGKATDSAGKVVKSQLLGEVTDGITEDVDLDCDTEKGD
jgi:hypothetical protein